MTNSFCSKICRNYFLKFDKNNFHQYNNTIIYKYKNVFYFINKLAAQKNIVE